MRVRRILASSLACLLVASCSSPGGSSYGQPLESPSRTVSGDPLADCRLEDSPPGDPTHLAWPRQNSAAPSTGTLLVRVVFIDFPDALGTTSPDYLMDEVTEGVNDYYRKASYGALDIEFAHHPEWITMERASVAYSWEGSRWNGFVHESIEAADPEVDFTDTDVLIIVTPPELDHFERGIASTRAEYRGWRADHFTMTNVITLGSILLEEGRRATEHELGHALGLPDLYEYGPPETDRFTGTVGLMGVDYGDAPGLFAYERWLLGWLADDQVLCLTTAQEVTLTAIELGEGTSMVMVRTGPSTLLVVESRKSFGTDVDFRYPGVLVYEVDSSIASGEGPIQLLPEEEARWGNTALTEGEYIVIGDVFVRVSDSDITSDTIEIDFDD